MRKFFLISSAALSLFAVGCATPERVCEAGVDQACERSFECLSDTVKNSDGFKSQYGTSVAECKTKQYAAKSCSARKEDNDNCTDNNAGKTFNLDAASDCSDARAKLSCADYLDASKTPAVCANICT